MSFQLKEYISQAEKNEKSKEFIDATVSYAKKLMKSNYPVIFSLEHLSILMGVQSSYLRYLIAEPKSKYGIQYQDEPYKLFRYNYFKLKKKRGGYREIMSPSKDLKYIQTWILKNLIENCELEDSCIGFRKNLSIKDNALPHEGADMILKVDLLKFYDTITEKRVFAAFADMGYTKNLAVSLAKLTTAKHRFKYWDDIPKEDLKKMGYLESHKPSILPQGAPSSPTLANIVASRMDRRFEGLAKKLGFKYTRYADDLTFSIKGEERLPNLKWINKIVSEEKFIINEKKVKYYKKGVKQYVTGLTVTNGVNVSKKYRKRIASHIHFCRRFGVELHLIALAKKNENHRGVIAYHDWLYGHICFIQSINKKAGIQLLENFSKINWFIS